MSCSQKFFLSFFPVLFITALASGCVHTGSSRYSEAPAGAVFLSPNPHFEAGTFAQGAGQTNHSERIHYLLERVAASDERFIRNGKTHNGKQARQWLLYKKGHWVSGVETAEDFVNRVASFSKKTGEPYLVEYSDGRTYSLASVLKNELSIFDEQQSKLRASQVSLSSTAVASTAVAASTSS